MGKWYINRNLNSVLTTDEFISLSSAAEMVLNPSVSADLDVIRVQFVT